MKCNVPFGSNSLTVINAMKEYYKLTNPFDVYKVFHNSFGPIAWRASGSITIHDQPPCPRQDWLAWRGEALLTQSNNCKLI